MWKKLVAQTAVVAIHAKPQTFHLLQMLDQNAPPKTAHTGQTNSKKKLDSSNMNEIGPKLTQNGPKINQI